METLILVSLLMQTNNIDIDESLNRNILKSTIVQATITENLPKRKPNLIDDNGWTRTYNRDTDEYDLCYECHPEFFKGDDGQPHLVDYPNYSGPIIYNEQLNKCVPRVRSVPEPKSFPKTTKHQGHNCPNCGQSQYIIASYNGDGTHNHTCRMCGTTWNH